MKLFKQTWFAVLLCVIAVVGTTLLDTRVDFGGKCADIRATLYQPDSSGVSIPEELAELLTTVDSLTALAEERGLDSENTQEEVRYLRLLLNSGEAEASQLHRYYREMMAALDELIGNFDGLSMNSHDSATLQRCVTAIDNTRAAIEDSGYNDSVAAFLKSYYRFPTISLASAVGVVYPELFN